MMNSPDVSMVASNVFSVDGLGQICVAGTSISSPLWAGYTALVNQQSATNGLPPVGFLNPLLTTIGRGGKYATDFHDIMTGNNENAGSPDLYQAVPGYDLATGWGTPAGQGLINDLSTIGGSGTPSFNLSISPYGVFVILGQSAATTVTVNRFNGFGGSVTLTSAGMPSGVSASFGSNASTTSALTLTTSTSTPTGTYSITVTGTSGNLTHTVAFTLTVIAPDFVLSASPTVLNLTLGGSLASTIAIRTIGGFDNSVILTASGLPPGVQASFSPTGSASKLALSATAQAAPGAYSISIAGLSGNLSHAIKLGLVVAGSSTSAPVPVDLSSAFGDVGISVDGASFDYDPGDHAIYAYSANLLGNVQVFGGIPFSLGPPNAWDDAAPAAGLTIPLPPGQFGSLQVLATGINGSQSAQQVQIAYTDGTKDTFTQSFSDWKSPHGYQGETIAQEMPYGNDCTGAQSVGPVYLYGYSTILRNKTVASVSLPSNANLRVYAMTLVPAVLTSVSDYDLAVSTSVLTIGQGQNGTATITVSPLGGFASAFAGTVTFTASGLPAGLAASFSPTSSTQRTVLTLSASATISPSVATISVRGTSGSISHTVTITVNVVATVFSDFGPNNGFSTNGFCISGPNTGDCGPLVQRYIAAPFVASANLTLLGITLPIGYVSGTNGAVINLMGTSEGFPSAVLESWSLPNLPGSPAVTSVSSKLSPVLAAGQTYWAEVEPIASDSLMFWYTNDLGLPGGVVNNGQGWSPLSGYGGQTLPAFGVTGIILPTSIRSGGITPIYSPASTIQPTSWVTIYGTNLASSTLVWKGNFPTILGGTSVAIDGKAAYLSYVSPGQINLQAPDDSNTGSVPVVVETPTGTATSTVTLGPFGPSFCLLDAKHVAGIILRSDGSGAYGGGTYDIIGPTGNSLGYQTVAAKAGDAVALFGVGFGPTTLNVPAGQAFSGAAATRNPVQLQIDGVGVTPSFAGLTGAGLYQLNLTIPPNAGTGDVALVATVGGSQTPSEVVISLQ